MACPTPNWSRALHRTLLVALVAGVVGSGALVGASATGDTTGDETPDTRTDAAPIEPGETVTANLSDGDDVDWYAVNATAGEAVVAKLGLLNTSGNRSVEVNVYGPDGALGTEGARDKADWPRRVAGVRSGPAGFNATGVAPDVAESTGTYYVEVKESRWNETAEGVSSPYNLTVTTEPLDEYDPNENASTATPIEVGQPIEGVVTPYDHDVFAVNLTEGRNYTVTFNVTNLPDGAYDKALSLHTDPSNVTDDRPEEGVWRMPMYRNASKTFTAPQSGTNYLRLGQAGTTLVLLERADYRLTVVPANASSDGAGNGSDGDAGDGGGDGTDGDSGDGASGGTGGDGADDDGSGDGADGGATPTPAAADGGGGGDSTATDTPAIDDATATATGTATVGDGNAGDGAASTATTGGVGPGFGAVAALLGLVAVALLALRPDGE